MVRAVLLTLLAAGTLGACASSVNQVPVRGEEPQIVLLAGEWQGDYRGVESGRLGTIQFDLATGRHTAEGQVTMKPANAPADVQGIPLRIKFVQVTDGRINGKIEPYVDPQCGCKVETEFYGDMSGNHINGKFVTRPLTVQRPEQIGLWSVTRVDS